MTTLCVGKRESKEKHALEHCLTSTKVIYDPHSLPPYVSTIRLPKPGWFPWDLIYSTRVKRFHWSSIHGSKVVMTIWGEDCFNSRN